MACKYENDRLKEKKIEKISKKKIFSMLSLIFFYLNPLFLLSFIFLILSFLSLPYFNLNL